MLNKVMVFPSKLSEGTSTSVSPNKIIDASAGFVLDGIKPGDKVFNKTTFQNAIVVAVVSGIELTLSSDIFTAIDQEYSVYSPSTYYEAEKVSNSNILKLVKSNLTSPSTEFPAYSNIGEMISLYPESISGYGAVRADYFRHPKPPKWTYVTLGGGEPAFDQSQPDYQDFELPLEDEYKLVTKILEYCGIVIREIEVSQFGTAQQQHEQPTFSMQQ